MIQHLETCDKDTVGKESIVGKLVLKQKKYLKAYESKGLKFWRSACVRKKADGDELR